MRGKRHMAKKAKERSGNGEAAAVTKKEVLQELRRVKGPDLSDNIVALGLVSEIVIHKDKVYFAISVDPARAQELEPLRQAAETVVSELPGVASATVSLTARPRARLGFKPAAKCAVLAGPPRRCAGQVRRHRPWAGASVRRVPVRSRNLPAFRA